MSEANYKRIRDIPRIYQDQERGETGGHHLTQAVHGNIGESIYKVKLGE